MARDTRPVGLSRVRPLNSCRRWFLALDHHDARNAFGGAGDCLCRRGESTNFLLFGLSQNVVPVCSLNPLVCSGPEFLCKAGIQQLNHPNDVLVVRRSDKPNCVDRTRDLHSFKEYAMISTFFAQVAYLLVVL